MSKMFLNFYNISKIMQKNVETIIQKSVAKYFTLHKSF